MVFSHGGEVDGDEVLTNHSHLPSEQIEFVPEATLETVNAIERGILFLIAFWSGPAIEGFENLTKELVKFDTRNFRVVVADVDGACDLRQLREVDNSLMNGDGRTLWIRDGKVVATLTPIDGCWDRHEVKQRMSQLDFG